MKVDELQAAGIGSDCALSWLRKLPTLNLATAFTFLTTVA
jgi:hypothetical protein